MRIGRLNKQVILQTPVEVQSSTGAPETTWSTLARVHAEIKPMSAQESTVGGGILSIVDTLITIRWSPALVALTAKSRVVHLASGRLPVYYNIVGPIEPDTARAELQLRCKSGANEG